MTERPPNFRVTTADHIRSIAVIGAGVMGHGIAQEFAAADYDVRMTARSEESLARAMDRVRDNVERLRSMGTLDEDQARKATDNIRTSVSMADAVDGVDLVMEYVFEDLDLKRGVFAELDRLCPPHAILATGTSSLMPSDLAVATDRPDKVLAAHYANPPYLLPFVEIVGATGCSPESIQTTVDLLLGIGKQPVVLKKEVPGFAAMRLQGALLREALWLVERGVATPADVDTIIKTGIGRRWSVAGVFEVFELAGWDLMASICEWLFPYLEKSPEAPPALRDAVARGDLGVKTGKGFYEWTPELEEILRRRIANALVEIDRWPQDEAGTASGR